MNEVYKEIAWKLINLRQERGLTQEQLGEKIGLSKYQICRVERGLGETTLENLNTLTRFFEIPLESLFKKQQVIDIKMQIRTEYLEKSTHGPITRTYSNALHYNHAKIKSLVIPPRTIRKLRLEKHLHYEIYVLSGQITARTEYDTVSLKTAQVLSIKGHGTFKLVNIHSKSAAFLILTY